MIEKTSRIGHYQKMSTAAVILAAGFSRRMGQTERNTPKQMLPLGGKPILSYSVDLFNRLSAIDCLCIVTRPELREQMEDLESVRNITKPLYWAKGGERRQDSTRNGLLALPVHVEIVCVHDAARPFPPPMAITQALGAATQMGGAIVAIPINDTVKEIQEGGKIKRTLDRQKLWLAQTPQVFRRELLLLALDMAEKNETSITDEASAVEALGNEVIIIHGSKMNFKITTSEDLAMAEAILSK